MKRKRTSIFLYILSALLLAGGLFLVIRQYVLIPGVYVPPDVDVVVTPGYTKAPTPSPAVTPGSTGTPAVSPEQTPYVQKLPMRIYFLKAKIMCDIVPVGRIEEGPRAGQMDTVDDPDLAAWYQHGPSPGEEGNALLNGHKSWQGKIGRFSVLWDMVEGDLVAIAYDDGSLSYFAVTSVAFYPYDDVPQEVMNLTSETPMMTLITCYGDFDRLIGTSKQRCVVVCEPIADDDPRLTTLQ